MLARYHHLGNLPRCTWLFDFEPAALGACIDVFSPLRVQGCAFHYAKVINAKRDALGLEMACKEKDEHDVLTHQANLIKKWFKRVRYLCFPLEHLRLQFARDLLNAVFTYPSPIISAQLKEFCDYFKWYWITMPLIHNIWGSMETAAQGQRITWKGGTMAFTVI
uniref:MULE transposase domain-containing protein n=1 Tax=Plectus sambesii TaxID=2011161 RepID=A0A914XP09_9BILA